MKHKPQTHQHGFTLIEMIVSLALFSVVVTVAVGALLVLISTNDELQGEQSVMTNLSFAIDSMTREIRTGTNYYCVSAPSQSGVFSTGNSLEALADQRLDCDTGMGSLDDFHGVAFTEAGDSITGASAERILYYYDRPAGQLFRRVGDNAPQSIVSSGIFVEDADFIVTGTDTVEDGDTVQPMVTLQVQAVDVESTDLTQKSYFIQTTITQRTLDI